MKQEKSKAEATLQSNSSPEENESVALPDNITKNVRDVKGLANELLLPIAQKAVREANAKVERHLQEFAKGGYIAQVTGVAWKIELTPLQEGSNDE